jgi:outer membrane protein
MMRVFDSRWMAIALAGSLIGVLPGGTGLLAQQSSPPSHSSASSTNVMDMNYSQGRAFPNFFDAFHSLPVPEPSMSNSELLHALIQKGKLELSLEDAISLALENNLDIAVARYDIPLAQADYLRTKAGGAVRGVSGITQISNALFAGAIGGNSTSAGGGGTGNAGGFSGGGGAVNLGSAGCCDPFAGFSAALDQSSTPLNSLVLSGIPVSTFHSAQYGTFFGQGFLTGTSYVLSVNGSRQSNNQRFQLFNPYVPAFFGITVSQPLLKGFGYRANAAQLRIARNDLKVTDSAFRQQVITTVGQILILYYTLLADRENVRVAQQAVNYSQKLLDDNKKQVQIGTLAPIEVVRAESELAADQQALIVAQTTYREDGEKLKTALSKRVDSELAAVEVEPTDSLPEPQPSDLPPLPEALAEAAKNRPEIEQTLLNLRNQDLTIQSTRNGLLPSLNAFASFADFGLAGNRPVFGSCPAGATFDPTRLQCNVGGRIIPPPVVGIQKGGSLQSLTQLLHGTYPDYSIGLTLTIPIRNRQAQADATTALLQRRQLETQLQRTKNTIEQDVRNAEIAVTQAKAQIDAAVKARILAQQTLEAEQKKFKLGESTTLNVILTERDLTTAEGNEAKARAAYAQALVQFQQATGTILDKHHIQMAAARRGEANRVPNIPGAPPASTPPASN